MSHRIPAGVGERAQYVAHKYNDTTIRFILKYPGALVSETLCAATKMLVSSVDVLHASFIAKAGSAHWEVNAEYEISDYYALMDCDGDPMKPAKSIALQPMDHKAKCQLHVTQINGSGSCAVVVRISHLVVDGSDGKYLLNKLAESYRLIDETGTADALIVKNGDRSATCAYSKISKRKFASLLKVPFSGVKTEYPFEAPTEHGVRRMLHCTIPAEVLAAARQKAKTHEATINDLLITACYRSFAETTNHQGAMSISGMMDLRQHCKDGVSEGLSNMSGVLATTLTFSPENCFSQDLKCIAEQTKKVKNDPLSGLEGLPLVHMATKTLPMWLLLKAADIVYSHMSLNFTNLGKIPCEPLSMNGLVPTNGIFGGPLKRKPSVQVGVASFDDTTELTILGDFTEPDIRSLAAFLDGIRMQIVLYLEESQ